MGVAVSGGGDSVALLLLMADWAERSGRKLSVVTVDHGLREEAAAEAKSVANLCAGLGLDHETMLWHGWDRIGNLQDAARRARQRLIGGWAEKNKITAVLTGHTRDDQVETFLMRLARGSGVDGLAAILPAAEIDGLMWLRPLLQVSRNELRDFLRKQNVGWSEDPSNEDTGFERVRMRKSMAGLADLGLTTEVLSATAGRMQTARQALELATERFARMVAEPRESGAVRLDKAQFLAGPEELQLRLLAHCLKWVSGGPYRPRLQALRRVLDGVSEGTIGTLSGCIVGFVSPSVVEVCREANAVAVSSDLNGLFDGRWRITGQIEEKSTILRALGEDGILLRPDWRDTAETRNVILSSLSIWYNNELMSAPIVDKDGPWTCRLMTGVHDFFTSIVTH